MWTIYSCILMFNCARQIPTYMHHPAQNLLVVNALGHRTISFSQTYSSYMFNKHFRILLINQHYIQDRNIVLSSLVIKVKGKKTVLQLFSLRHAGHQSSRKILRKHEIKVSPGLHPKCVNCSPVPKTIKIYCHTKMFIVSIVNVSLNKNSSSRT